MGKAVIHEDMFPGIIDRYNTQGKTAAYEYLRSSYGIKNPYFVLKRIKACGKYTYDATADKFLESEADAAEDIFMDLDQLCGNTVVRASQRSETVAETRPVAMEKLVHELISDRLLTLSRYIILDSSTRTILIDQSSMTADGYQVVTH